MGTLRKRGVIPREIIKDGINEQSKRSQQGTLVNLEIPSNEDTQHKETNHITVYICFSPPIYIGFS